MDIKLGHIIIGGRSCGEMGGQRRGDSVGIYRKVGGARFVTTLGGIPEFPLHCTMEGDKLKFTNHPILGRGD